MLSNDPIHPTPVYPRRSEPRRRATIGVIPSLRNAKEPTRDAKKWISYDGPRIIIFSLTSNVASTTRPSTPHVLVVAEQWTARTTCAGAVGDEGVMARPVGGDDKELPPPSSAVCFCLMQR